MPLDFRGKELSLNATWLYIHIYICYMGVVMVIFYYIRYIFFKYK